jgi:predicted transcriptional regulator
MRMKYNPIKQVELKELFKGNIAMDMDDLIRKTGSSRTTILRRLKEIGYLTSYDHNGKYFALPEFLNFDESELFEHKGIHFFKNGGLQELITHQINSSEKGYNVEELSSKIKTRVGNQLRLFTRKGMLARKKYSDAYIYFSIHEKIQQKQISNREKELKISSTPEEINLSNEKITIRILLEIIKNPKAEAHEIGKSLREDGLKITDSFITNVFEKYDIQKKGFPSHF